MPYSEMSCRTAPNPLASEGGLIDIARRLATGLSALPSRLITTALALSTVIPAMAAGMPRALFCVTHPDGRDALHARRHPPTDCRLEAVPGLFSPRS